MMDKVFYLATFPTLVYSGEQLARADTRARGGSGDFCFCLRAISGCHSCVSMEAHSQYNAKANWSGKRRTNHFISTICVNLFIPL